MSSDDELKNSISKIVDENIKEHVAILGISVGSEIATNIYSKFKPELEGLSEIELIASATSFHYISNGLFKHLSKNNAKSTYVTDEKHIFLIQIINKISASLILDRNLAEMEGINKYKEVLNRLILKISALVETNDFVQEDPLVKILQAVPTALYLAIISKEGIPIKVIDNNNLESVIIGSQVAALSNLTQTLMKNDMDYTYIEGNGAIVLVIQFDFERILILSVPEDQRPNVGQFLARIKEIIRNYEFSRF